MLRSPALDRWKLPALIFVVCACVYVATLGARVRGLSDNAHYVHLADSFLHGQLSVVGNRPPGNNDWSHYQGRWYVSFPPFPALVILPAVAVFGLEVWDRLFWALFAGLAPALLYVLLRDLSERGLSTRSLRENLSLTALFAFGSVYYYTAVQGTVWFAAHVVCAALIPLYLWCALGARRPLWAGLLLGLAFMTRPTTLLLGVVFLVETLVAAQATASGERGSAPALAELSGLARWRGLLRGVRPSSFVRALVLFALPLAAVGGIAMWLNAARFDDPFEFGHTHLDIRWKTRIDRWGLFNYHYLAKNLAVFTSALPWLSATAPFVKISRHGLALWVTTPHYLALLHPKRSSLTTTGLALGAFAVALLDLCYQNSGWIQFGYRFSLDYAALLIALLALGGRRIGVAFYALLVCAVAVNLFGAVTFDRVHRFYDRDPTQNVIFQPD